jgi:hypothetical protein
MSLYRKRMMAEPDSPLWKSAIPPGGEGDPDRRADRPRDRDEEDAAVDSRDEESRRRNPRSAPAEDPGQFEEFVDDGSPPSEPQSPDRSAGA